MKLRFQIGSNRPLREAERQDVLRRLLAEEVVDAKDLLLVEHLVQLGVERHGARQVGAERLLHDDARVLDQARVAQHAHRRQRRARRHAQIVQARGFRAPMDCSARATAAASAAGAAPQRHVVEACLRRRPSRRRSTLRAENSSSASRANARKPSASSSSSDTPMMRQPGMKPALARCRMIGLSLDDLDADGFRRVTREALNELSARKVRCRLGRVFGLPRLCAAGRGARSARRGRDARGAIHRRRKPAAGYSSVPHSAALSAVRTLGDAGLVANSRVIMEKPFGTDLASACR